MVISKTDQTKIRDIFSHLKGLRTWGVLVSMADVSIEIGEPWKDPKTFEVYGKYTLFISCHWELRDESERLISDDMQYERDASDALEAFINKRTIESVCFDLNTHSLIMELDSKKNLKISPIKNESALSDWTLFYDKNRFSYSFNGVSIGKDL